MSSPFSTLTGVATGYANLTQDQLNQIATEGIDLLTYAPNLQFDKKQAQSYSNPIDPNVAKAGNQPYPTVEEHPISVHLVKTIATYSDLLAIESWQKQALSNLEASLATEEIAIDSLDTLTTDQKHALKTYLGDTSVTFTHYKNSLKDPSNPVRSHISKIWMKKHWSPGGRHDALIYPDVYRMGTQIAFVKKVLNASIISTSSTLGLDPNIDPINQLSNFHPLIKSGTYSVDPNSTMFAAAMRDSCGSIVSGINNQITTYNALNISSDTVTKSTSDTMSAVMYGTVVNPTSQYNQFSPVSILPISSVNLPNPFLQITSPGIGVGASMISELILILEGLYLIFSILNDNGFQLIQALEAFLDTLIDTFIGALLMETISILSMVQGQMMQPLITLLFSIDSAVSPFLSNPQTWDAAGNMIVTSVEGLTGKFYSKLLDWYRKEVSQINNAISKAVTIGTNNQYGNFLKIIQETISYLNQLQFYSYQFQGITNLDTGLSTVGSVGSSIKNDFNVPPVSYVPNGNGTGTFVPNSQSFATAVGNASNSINNYYSNCAQLPSSPSQNISYPHIMAKTEVKIVTGIEGQINIQGQGYEIAQQMLDSIGASGGSSQSASQMLD